MITNHFVYVELPNGSREYLTPSLFSELAQTSPNALTYDDIVIAMMWLPSNFSLPFHDFINRVRVGNKTTYNFFIMVRHSKDPLPTYPPAQR